MAEIVKAREHATLMQDYKNWIAARKNTTSTGSKNNKVGRNKDQISSNDWLVAVGKKHRHLLVDFDKKKKMPEKITTSGG